MIRDQKQKDIVIDSVFFAQTHVMEPHHPYFKLTGGRDTLIKVHVLSPSGAAAPEVSATLSLAEESRVMELEGPQELPKRFCKEPGKVQHTFCMPGTARAHPPKAPRSISTAISDRRDSSGQIHPQN